MKLTLEHRRQIASHFQILVKNNPCNILCMFRNSSFCSDLHRSTGLDVCTELHFSQLLLHFWSDLILLWSLSPTMCTEFTNTIPTLEIVWYFTACSDIYVCNLAPKNRLISRNEMPGLNLTRWFNNPVSASWAHDWGSWLGSTLSVANLKPLHTFFRYERSN